MRWVVFIIFAAVAVTLDVSFMGVFSLRFLDSVTPSVVAVLAVFIALFAGRQAALWGCLVLGVIVDLCTPLPQPDEWVVHVIGPHALGFLVGGYAILQMRAMVFRQRALTIGILTLVFMTAVALVAIAFYLVRSWYPEDVLYPTAGSAFGAFLRMELTALYSALFAIPVGWLLVQTSPAWGFDLFSSRRR